MNKFFPIILGCALCCGAFTSCTGEPVEAPVGDWQVVYFEIGGVAQQLCNATMTISLENEVLNVAGYSGVNNYSGSFSRANAKLTSTGNFISTRMAGPAEAMTFEKDFLETLQGASSYSLALEDGKNTLVIYNKDNNASVKFVPITLVGSQWRLSAVNSEAGTIGVAIENGKQSPFIRFDDSFAYGFTGVNSMQFNYQLDETNHKIAFSAGAATLSISGEENENILEGLILSAIGNTSKYAVSGNTLTFYNSNDEILLFFEKMDFVK